MQPGDIEWIQNLKKEMDSWNQKRDCECSGFPVEVIIWYPTLNEINGIGGHVTYNIDGYMWSWEGDGWANGGQPEPAEQYLSRNQQYRSGHGYLVDFGSPGANSDFIYSIKHAYDTRPLFGFPPGKFPYNLVTNNCGNAFSRALFDNGYGNDLHIAPLGHKLFIENNLKSKIIGEAKYPQR
jgi:hypothetical protein